MQAHPLSCCGRCPYALRELLREPVPHSTSAPHRRTVKLLALCLTSIRLPTKCSHTISLSQADNAHPLSSSGDGPDALQLRL